MMQQFEDIVAHAQKRRHCDLLAEQNLYSALVSTDRAYILDMGQVVYN